MTSGFALSVELITASHSNVSHEDYVTYVERRLDEEVASRADVSHLVAVLAWVAGELVEVWAQETGRDPAAVLQAVALAGTSFDPEGC